LTDDRGSDYQPDCSPDGRSVAFVRYDGRSMELMLLDLSSRAVRPLTHERRREREPRWSPDGNRPRVRVDGGYRPLSPARRRHPHEIARARLVDAETNSGFASSSFSDSSRGQRDCFVLESRDSVRTVDDERFSLRMSATCRRKWPVPAVDTNARRLPSGDHRGPVHGAVRGERRHGARERSAASAIGRPS